MSERLLLSAHRQKRGLPGEMEVTVLDRKPIRSGEDPVTHVSVFSNTTWIRVEGFDPKRFDHIFPGGLVVEEGLSGSKELVVETHEVWDQGQLVRAQAHDPRPLNQRRPQFAISGS